MITAFYSDDDEVEWFNYWPIKPYSIIEGVKTSNKFPCKKMHKVIDGSYPYRIPQDKLPTFTHMCSECVRIVQSSINGGIID